MIGTGTKFKTVAATTWINNLSTTNIFKCKRHLTRDGHDQSHEAYCKKLGSQDDVIKKMTMGPGSK